MNLKKNVGTHDAHIRIVIGVFSLLFAIFLVENPTAKILFAVFATILAGTASLRFCLLYILLHKTTYEDTPMEKTMRDNTITDTNTTHINDSASESTEEGDQ